MPALPVGPRPVADVGVVPSAPSPTSHRPGLSSAARAAVDVRPDEIIRRWLAGLSETARRTYRLALTRFAHWALTDQDAPPESALRLLVDVGCGPAHELVTRWRDELLGTGLATGSVGAMVTSISSLLKSVRRAGLITWRLESVAPRVERREDRSGPRRQEVERLLQHIDGLVAKGDARATRDAALVRLMYCSAMRRSEITGLRFPEDVLLDHHDGASVRPRRKGSRERQSLLLSDGSAASLLTWIAVRGEDQGPLFCRVGARDMAHTPHLSGETLRRMLRERAAAAGVMTIVRPHGLRHSAATQVARDGSLDGLMALGGWRSFAAARVYLDGHAEQRRRALSLIDV